MDSTPFEASRYDKCSDYPHYNCKMDKAHIAMPGINGLAHEFPELKKYIDFLKQYYINAKSYSWMMP
jgi:hypothetical protein